MKIERPPPDRRYGFVPLSKKEREEADLDEEVKLYQMCSKCAQYMEELEKKLGDYDESDTSGYTRLNEYVRDSFDDALVLAKQEYQYTRARESARTGCHLCSVLVRKTAEMYSVEYEEDIRAGKCAAIIPESSRFLIRIYGVVPIKARPDNIIRIKLFDPDNDQWLAGMCYCLSSFPLPLVPDRSTDTMDYLARHVTTISKSNPHCSSAITTGSMEIIKQAKEWLQDCQDNHPRCSMCTRAWLPTRLVEIINAHTVRLCETRQLPTETTYFALSYCWGTEPFLVTKKSSYSAFQASIPYELLPYTIQDALKTVYRMGGKFLWVDSLCIVQDDVNDWEHEAATMRFVYKNALLTIAALGASGANHGLFGKRNPLINNFVTPSSTHADKLLLLETDDFRWRTEVCFDEGPLHRRGWTYQERALSTRVLFFSANVFWECCSTFATEDGASIDFLSSESVWTQGPHYTNCMVDGMKAMQAAQESMSSPSFSSTRWITVVEEFTLRKLTIATDRQAAFYGIIDEFKNMFGLHDYCCLWKEDLGMWLLWYNASCQQTSLDYLPKKTAGVPSWSWASIASPIRYISLVAGSYADVTTCSSRPLMVKITAVISQVILTPTDELDISLKNKKQQDGAYIIRTHGYRVTAPKAMNTKLHHIRVMLDDDEFETRGQHYFVLLRWGNKTFDGIIVTKTGGEDSYQRVGCFTGGNYQDPDLWDRFFGNEKKTIWLA